MKTPRLIRIREAEGDTTEPAEEAINVDSLDGRAQLVRQAWNAGPGSAEDAGWVDEVHQDYLIINRNGLWRYSYEIDDDQNITFGQPEKVIAETTYRTTEAETGTPATPDRGTETGTDPEPTLSRERESLQGTILESLDQDAGWVWRVTMIRPGTSKNGRRYRPEVLREATELYEGARAFDGHRTAAERNQSAVGNLSGWHENVEAQPDGALQSDFHISESAPQIRQLFMSAARHDRPDLIGFSHDVSAYAKPAVEGGRKISDVTKIAEVHSVDIVADPSAGGRLERLVASHQRGESMTLQQLLEALAAASTDEERKQILAEAPAELREAVASMTGATITEATETDPVEEKDPEPVTEALKPGSLIHRLAVREAVDETKLPDDLKEKLRERFKDAEITDAEIRERVAETASMWSDVIGAAGQPLPGQKPAAEVTEAETDKHRKALDGLLAGEKVDDTAPFRSLKEAYVAFTGRNPYATDTQDFARDILAESVGAFATGGRRLTESITSSTWSSALGDSITRRAIAEYALPQLQTWRQIVSDIVPVNDFRTQRRDRIGGYDTLSVVSEGGTYTALTSPSDEEATYAPTKKGGTEDLTLETIANDDIGAVRRIPKNLGRAAALTLYRAIWVDILVTNPATSYDSVALFHSSHSNTTAVALGETGIGTLRNLMVTQARSGESSGFVGLTPRYLAAPPELYVTAYKLTSSESAVVGSTESATTPNPWRGIVPIEVPVWTDANDWILVADPATCPTIEVGFYQGREEPEILVQDQPAIGSVFTADKITYKVRHIWGLTVLDHRGFQRGTQ